MNIALLGFGTVGSHFYKLCEGRTDLHVAAVLSRRPRPELTCTVTADYDEIVRDPSIDIVVEVMGGIEPARAFVLRFIPHKVDVAIAGGAFKDYKTMLQEIVQKNKQETLEYRLAGQSGPDHDKRFTMELLLNSNVFASGTGRSKKEAEQLAAKKALEIMGC